MMLLVPDLLGVYTLWAELLMLSRAGRQRDTQPNTKGRRPRRIDNQSVVYVA